MAEALAFRHYPSYCSGRWLQFGTGAGIGYGCSPHELRLASLAARPKTKIPTQDQALISDGSISGALWRMLTPPADFDATLQVCLATVSYAVSHPMSATSRNGRAR